MKHFSRNTIKDPFAFIKKSKKILGMVEEELVKIRFGAEVENMRNLKKITQQKLAHLARTTQRIISDIEDGEYNAGSVLMNRIGQELGFTAENWALIFDAPWKIFLDAKPNNFNALNKFECFDSANEHSVNSNSLTK